MPDSVSDDSSSSHVESRSSVLLKVGKVMNFPGRWGPSVFALVDFCWLIISVTARYYIGFLTCGCNGTDAVWCGASSVSLLAVCILSA